MSDVEEATVTALLQALRLAQTALDEGFKTVIENGVPVTSPVAQEFFQILCSFRDSQDDFHRLVAKGGRGRALQ